MNLKMLIETARRLSRTSDSVADSVVIAWINEGLRQYVVDAGGLSDVYDTTFTGASVALPYNFYRLNRVRVGTRVLKKGDADMLVDNDIEGLPSQYYIAGNTMHFDRSVGTTTTSIRIVYERFVSPLASVSDYPEFPESSHVAIAYFAASKLAEENFEYEEAKRLYANYRNETTRALVNRGNTNTSIFLSAN